MLSENCSYTSSGLAQKSGKLVFLGLDNAGKTTLLYRLRDDKMGAHVPTLLPSKRLYQPISTFQLKNGKK